MKKMISVILILFTVSFSLQNSKLLAGNGGEFGAGIIIGEPTGLSFKYWLDGDNKNAVVGAIAWSLDNNKFFQIHADYLFHNYRIFKIKKGKLGFYFGGGARIKIRNDNDKDKDDTRLGLRIPFGLDYVFSNVPIDIFLEIVPVMDLIPSTDFNLNASIGARYFF